MQFEIKNRWSGAVQFTAEIGCSEDDNHGLKVGLAVLRSIAAGADLTRANLSGADLQGANLAGAKLRGADLSGTNLTRARLTGANLINTTLKGAILTDAKLTGADLRGSILTDANLTDANLRGADLDHAILTRTDFTDAILSEKQLRTYQADLWMLLSQYPGSVQGVANALASGRVDGATYSGECAALLGTIANALGCSVDLMPGDEDRPAGQWFMMIKPGDTPENSSAARQAAAWIAEWQAHQIHAVC